jgi:hypothetical protein
MLVDVFDKTLRTKDLQADTLETKEDQDRDVEDRS